MKRIVLIGCFLSLASFIFAQSGKRSLNDAYSAYSNEYYDRAQKAIDRCIEFDDTKAEAKTWFYRGNIYIMIEVMKTKKDSNVYKGLCDNCAEIAYDSYMQALKIDNEVEATSMNIKNPREGLRHCSGLLTRDAYIEIEKIDREKNHEKNYERAYQLAKKAYSANSSNPDAIYCVGYAAELVNKKEEAKSYYLKLLKMKENKNMYLYVRLANIYRDEDDASNAIMVMDEGAPLFLQDTNFNVDYAVAYSIVMLWRGRSEDAKDVMSKALQRDPNNHTLLTNYGSELNKIKRYDEAEICFKRALELKPNDAISNYNLGNCYYNKFVDKHNALDTVPDSQYAAAQAATNVILKQSRPYLEKAHELDPQDINTLIMLRNVYIRSDDVSDELKKSIEEKLKELREKK